MVSYGNRTREDKADQDPSNHANIRFGGAAEPALGNLAAFGGCLAESCYPFDQVVNKYGDDKKKADEMLERVRQLYFGNKNKPEGEVCFDCISQAVQEDLRSNANIADIKMALSTKTFEEFLYFVTIGKGNNSCPDVVEIQPTAQFKTFPQRGKTATPQQTIDQIRSVLKQGYPLALDGICPYKVDGKCTGRHSLVVTGYREQCPKDKTKKCKKVVRVQNSWGEDWQKRNDNGWVDAETLLGGETQEAGALSWWTK